MGEQADVQIQDGFDEMPQGYDCRDSYDLPLRGSFPNCRTCPDFTCDGCSLTRSNLNRRLSWNNHTHNAKGKPKCPQAQDEAYREKAKQTRKRK